jgi:hypothetical protein
MPARGSKVGGWTAVTALGSASSEVPGSCLAAAFFKLSRLFCEAACLASSRAECRQKGAMNPGIPLEKSDTHAPKWSCESDYLIISE